MKAIIYNDENAALAALSTCSSSIPQGEVEHLGEGPFIDPEPGKPYSTILKHPAESKWALIADEQVEVALGLTAEELDSSWFPHTSMIS